MSSSKNTPDRPDSETPATAPKKKARVRTHTPRPDELTRETFEFISAIDEYKRAHMRSFLNDDEVLAILHDLGYRPAGRPAAAREPDEAELAAYAEARQRYRVEQGRLFPTWSEVFELLRELGYTRVEGRDAA